MQLINRRFLSWMCHGGPARRDPIVDDPTAGTDTNGGGTSDADDRQDTGAKPPSIDGDLDPERAKRAIAAARAAEKKALAKLAEAGASKAATEKALSDLREKLAVQLGLKSGTDDPVEAAKQALADRESAVKERDDMVAKLAVMQVENAIGRLAGKAGADPGELLDSAAFMRTVGDLDPSDSGFEDAMAEAIRDAVETNPRRYGTAATAKPEPKPKPRAGVSGGEITGGTGAQPITEAQLKRMTPDEITKAYAEGRLTHLL